MCATTFHRGSRALMWKRCNGHLYHRIIQIALNVHNKCMYIYTSAATAGIGLLADTFFFPVCKTHILLVGHAGEHAVRKTMYVYIRLQLPNS